MTSKNLLRIPAQIAELWMRVEWLSPELVRLRDQFEWSYNVRRSRAGTYSARALGWGPVLEVHSVAEAREVLFLALKTREYARLQSSAEMEPAARRHAQKLLATSRQFVTIAAAHHRAISLLTDDKGVERDLLLIARRVVRQHLGAIRIPQGLTANVYLKGFGSSNPTWSLILQALETTTDTQGPVVFLDLERARELLRYVEHQLRGAASDPMSADQIKAWRDLRDRLLDLFPDA